MPMPKNFGKDYNLQVECTLCHKKLKIPHYCRGHVVTCPECGVEPLYIPIATPWKRTWGGLGVGVLVLLAAIFLTVGYSNTVAAPICLLMGIMAVPLFAILANLTWRLRHIEELVATPILPAPVPEEEAPAE